MADNSDLLEYQKLLEKNKKSLKEFQARRRIVKKKGLETQDKEVAKELEFLNVNITSTLKSISTFKRYIENCKHDN